MRYFVVGAVGFALSSWLQESATSSSLPFSADPAIATALIALLVVIYNGWQQSKREQRQLQAEVEREKRQREWDIEDRLAKATLTAKVDDAVRKSDVMIEQGDTLKTQMDGHYTKLQEELRKSQMVIEALTSRHAEEARLRERTLEVKHAMLTPVTQLTAAVPDPTLHLSSSVVEKSLEKIDENTAAQVRVSEAIKENTAKTGADVEGLKDDAAEAKKK